MAPVATQGRAGPRMRRLKVRFFCSLPSGTEPHPALLAASYLYRPTSLHLAPIASSHRPPDPAVAASTTRIWSSRPLPRLYQSSVDEEIAVEGVGPWSSSSSGVLLSWDLLLSDSDVGFIVRYFPYVFKSMPDQPMRFSNMGSGKSWMPLYWYPGTSSASGLVTLSRQMHGYSRGYSQN